MIVYRLCMFSKAESNNEFKAESENNLKIKKKRVNPLFMLHVESLACLFKSLM